MKKEINNFIIDIIALIGGAFYILLAIAVFIIVLVSDGATLEFFDGIIIPGIIEFFGIIVLFAVRITRSLTKKEGVNHEKRYQAICTKVR